METVLVPLTRGKYAVIDADNAERVLAFKWHAIQPKKDGTWYAARNHYVGGKRVYIFLHRFIMDAQPGVQVDHVNRDGLLCTRKNMRLCTNAQNNANKPKSSTGSSDYKGVYWHRGARKWMARIQKDGKTTYLGIFVDPADAARAYDAAAREAHGEFAVLNFP